MPNFHRLAVPSYFGGLPAGYDYINNAISGTPANANGVLTGGPNTGSYFVGFGDDATSANANRPNLALATNTDYLDNLLHQDLAVPTASSQITSAGDTTFVAPAQTYVGKPGTPNTQAGILSFAKVLDINGNEIEVAGVAVQVASITGATVGTNFSSGSVTFNFNIPVPASTVYQVWYATRSNLAVLPIDAFTNITIRTTQELPAAFEDFEKQIATFSGLNVTSLVATRLQTPDGTRLAKSSAMAFSVDPDGTVGGLHQFNFQIAESTGGARTIFALTDSGALPGMTGAAGRDSGVVDIFNTFWWVSDVNSQTYAGGTPYSSLIKMTSASAHGASVQFWEKAATAFDVSTYGLDLGVMSHINARWTVTCGDGTSTFGDFNGIGAIQNALAYAALHSITNGRIQLKAGTYQSNSVTGQIVIPDSGNFIIEGVDALGVFIESTGVGSPATMIKVGPSAGGAFLELRNVFMTNTSPASTTYGIDFSNSSLVLDTVTLNNYALLASAPVVNQYSAPSGCFFAKNCHMGNSGINAPLMTVVVPTLTAWTEISGLVFEDCYLASNNNYPVMLVQANAALTGVGAVSGVKFNRCQIFLGWAGTTGTHLTGNSGVIAVDPNGMSNGALTLQPGGYQAYANILYLRDASWVDCRVQAVTNANANQSDILMHLVPFTNGVATPSIFAAIGKIAIQGGRWEVGEVNGTGNHEMFSPFFVAARNVVIDNVTFRGSVQGGNGRPTSDMMNTVLGNGNTTAWTDSFAATVPFTQIWGAFTAAPGALQVYDPPTVVGGVLGAGTTPMPAGLTMRNVTISNLPRDGGVGDLFLNVAAINNNVDGITLTDYYDTTLGIALPACRAWIYSRIPAYGHISGIHMTGQDAAAGHQWVDTTGAAPEHEGFFRLTPGGRLHLEDCTIEGFTLNGFTNNNSVGFVLTVPVSPSSLYSPNGLWLESCYSNFSNHGFVFGSGSATHPAIVVRLSRCHSENHTLNGYWFGNTHAGIGNEFIMEGCHADGNASRGLLLNGVGLISGVPDVVSITGCSLKTNTGTYQVEYIPTTEYSGVFMNNDLGWSGETRAHPGGSPITSGTTMLGFETGTGASTSARSYANGSSMLFNNGVLFTI